MNKIAVIQVGFYPIEREGASVYYFNEDISEMELREEVRALKDFYEEIEIQMPLPVHIRFAAVDLKSL